MSNPYQNFKDNLENDENPNFLRYILCVLEKHSYAQESELYRNIRTVLEKRYNLESDDDLWEPPQKK